MATLAYSGFPQLVNKPSGPQWFQFQTSIARIPVKYLSHGAKVLYSRLAYYGYATGQCYPKHSTLALEIGVGISQIKEYLNELRDYGLISWQRTGHSSFYKIHSPDSRDSGYRDSRDSAHQIAGIPAIATLYRKEERKEEDEKTQKISLSDELLTTLREEVPGWTLPSRTGKTATKLMQIDGSLGRTRFIEALREKREDGCRSLEEFCKRYNIRESKQQQTRAETIFAKPPGTSQTSRSAVPPAPEPVAPPEAEVWDRIVGEAHSEFKVVDWNAKDEALLKPLRSTDWFQPELEILCTKARDMITWMKDNDKKTPWLRFQVFLSKCREIRGTKYSFMWENAIPLEPISIITKTPVDTELLDYINRKRAQLKKLRERT
jgi:hypothetical protein